MNAGSVTITYETGAVTGGTTRGGLVGVRAAGAVSKSFWDSDSNSLVGGPGGFSAGGTAATELQLNITAATEATSIYHAAGWNFKTIWTAPVTSGLPTLTAVPGP